MTKGVPSKRSVMLGIFSIIIWMFFSSALIILNKNLYKMGFEKPMLVTGGGQLFSLLGGLLMVWSGFWHLRPLPSSRYV